MEHVVFFPTPDGVPAYRRFATLEEAVRLVEHLRNVEGIDQVSVHALTEVPLAFKAYYRVEMPAVSVVAAEAAPAVDVPTVAVAGPMTVTVPVVPVQAVSDDPVPAVEDKAEPAAASLGYFAR